MCEFIVYRKDEIVFKDAVYAKLEDNTVLVKDIMGASKLFENCQIKEVNVESHQLILV